MLAYARGQALVAEVADNHPEFERAEASPELDAVLRAVAHRLRFGSLQIRRRHKREGAAQGLHVEAVEDRKVKGREEPLVRVGDEGVGALTTREDVAHLREDCC